MEPSDTTDKIKWKSNYPEIATVSSSGNVTAKTVGIAKITATTTSGVKAYRYVRVKLKAPTNVKVKKLSTKAKGKSMQI
ncbi:MAG: Ig-like domain-containing protein [Eubacterium sp.]